MAEKRINDGDTALAGLMANPRTVTTSHKAAAQACVKAAAAIIAELEKEKQTMTTIGIDELHSSPFIQRRD